MDCDLDYTCALIKSGAALRLLASYFNDVLHVNISLSREKW